MSTWTRQSYGESGSALTYRTSGSILHTSSGGGQVQELWEEKNSCRDVSYFHGRQSGQGTQGRGPDCPCEVIGACWKHWDTEISRRLSVGLEVRLRGADSLIGRINHPWGRPLYDGVGSWPWMQTSNPRSPLAYISASYSCPQNYAVLAALLRLAQLI